MQSISIRTTLHIFEKMSTSQNSEENPDVSHENNDEVHGASGESSNPTSPTHAKFKGAYKGLDFFLNLSLLLVFATIFLKKKK
jgi:hypothetical protein